MKTAKITFTATAELRLCSPLFPSECDTDEKRLAYWLRGANEDAITAMRCVGAELTVTGDIMTTPLSYALDLVKNGQMDTVQ